MNPLDKNKITIPRLKEYPSLYVLEPYSRIIGKAFVNEITIEDKGLKETYYLRVKVPIRENVEFSALSIPTNPKAYHPERLELFVDVGRYVQKFNPRFSHLKSFFTGKDEKCYTSKKWAWFKESMAFFPGNDGFYPKLEVIVQSILDGYSNSRPGLPLYQPIEKRIRELY
ncbi:MAG: hypothetical protein V2A62_00255 [Candidatus Woesearchaeota archaeon]